LELEFKRFILNLNFDKDTGFRIFPPFIFRSVFGNELRKLSCIKREQNCKVCDLKFQCIYSKIFETPIKKNNEILQNRNFAAHPFLFSTNKNIYDKTRNVKLNLVLIGYTLDYLPYIYYALKRAGEIGIFKSRLKYKIVSILAGDQELLQSEDSIDNDYKRDKWVLNNDSKIVYDNIKIEMVSPLRLKIGGKYQSKFGYSDFMKAGLRRLDILSKLYGKFDNKNDNILDINDLIIANKKENKHFTWQELERYSARQKTEMKLGGVVGIMDVEGEFSETELSIIDGIEKFHIGKNTSFGLGQIKTRRIKEG